MNFWKNKNVLLTGADGFVGSHLAEKLIDLGAKLTIVVRATSNHGTSAYNFKNLPNNYVKKCKRINKPFARKIQILTVMEQRSKVSGKTEQARIAKKAKESLRKQHGAKKVAKKS